MILRLRVLLLLTSLDKFCGVGLFSSNNGSVFGKIFESVWVLDFFLLTMEFCFGDIFESVHWEVICSIKRKEIRYEKISIRRITNDKLILKKIT